MGLLDDLIGDEKHRRNQEILANAADERDRIMRTNTWGNVIQKQHEDYKKQYPVAGLFETSSGIPPEQRQPQPVPDSVKSNIKQRPDNHSEDPAQPQTTNTFVPAETRRSWLGTAAWMAGAGVVATGLLGVFVNVIENYKDGASSPAQPQALPTQREAVPTKPALGLPNDGKPRRVFRVTKDAMLYGADGKPVGNRGVQTESCVIGDIVSGTPERSISARRPILAHDGKQKVEAHIFNHALQDRGTATSLAECKAVFITPPPEKKRTASAPAPVRYAEITGDFNLRTTPDRGTKAWGYIRTGSCVVLDGQESGGMAKIRLKTETNNSLSYFWVIGTSVKPFSPANVAECLAKIGQGEIRTPTAPFVRPR